MMKEKLSIIVPCYNEFEVIDCFYKEIDKVTHIMNEIVFEILFIDDGSTDGTLSKIINLSEQDERIKYISFSRNFGKEAAIYAGLKNSCGDYVAIMDVDLQDPPSLLPQMYKAVADEKFDSVATRRITRKGEPAIRSFFARLFYKLMRKISDTDIVDGARDFRLMNRKFVDSLLEVKEYNRFSKGLFSWVGFKTKWIEFENVERVAGETKWSFWKLLRYSIEGIVAFSVTPLVFASVIGIFFCILSFIGMIFIIIRKLLFGDPVSGWASMICIMCMFGGLQLFSMGIMGQYISKMYMEVKSRPIYIIDKSNID